MDFGEAIRVLKGGGRVRRAGWNGKGMWLALTPGTTVPTAGVISGSTHLRGAALSLWNSEAPDAIRIGAHIDMRAADGTLVIGWHASQSDMLSDDWETV